MAHGRTGITETCRDAEGRVYYRGRLRLDDGSLVRIDIPEEKKRSKTAARNYVAWAQEQEDSIHTLQNAKREGQAKREARIAGAAGETCDAWYERFKAHRKDKVSTCAHDAWIWSKWISKTRVRGGATTFGELPIADVNADDIEDVKDVLTAAVLAYEVAGNVSGDGRLAPKTAQNAWTALTTPMKFASTRKGPRELRVREGKGNPCDGIPPPRDGASKSRHWLRPHQWVKLVAWLAPRHRAWAEAYAIGLYLALRPGELHELRVKDLLLVDREVSITRAWDEKKRKVGPPKTRESVRKISIHPTLMPLLERIARERKADDLVCPVVAATRENARSASDLSRAELYREFLQAACIDAPEFFVKTRTHLMIDFRSLRDSGITWRFLAGERESVIQREAGHEHISTTLGYAKEVHDKRGRYGEPFPPLPAELVGAVQPPDPPTDPGDVTKRRDAHLGVPAAHVIARSAANKADERREASFSNPPSPTQLPRESEGCVARRGSFGGSF